MVLSLVYHLFSFACCRKKMLRGLLNSSSLGAAARAATPSFSSSSSSSLLSRTTQKTSSSSSSSIFCKGFATSAAGGSTKNRYGSGTPGKRLGLRRWQGHAVYPGVILVKQRGNSFHQGEGVGQGKDFTLYANTYGFVSFTKEPRKPGTVRTRKGQMRKFINVVPNHPDTGVPFTPELMRKEKERRRKFQRRLRRYRATR